MLGKLVAFLIACVISAQLGIWAAGPMPTIDRTPEPMERNYTLEVLRLLHPPPPPPQQVIEYRGEYPQTYGGYWISTNGMYNSRPERW